MKWIQFLRNRIEGKNIEKAKNNILQHFMKWLFLYGRENADVRSCEIIFLMRYVIIIPRKIIITKQKTEKIFLNCNLQCISGISRIEHAARAFRCKIIKISVCTQTWDNVCYDTQNKFFRNANICFSENLAKSLVIISDLATY